MTPLRWLGIGFLSCVMVGVITNFFRISRFDDAMGGNILLIGRGEIAVIGIRPKNGMVVYLTLPDDLFIPLSTNGGEVRVGAYRRGLKEKNGLELTRASISNALGISISGVIKGDVSANIDGLSEALWKSLQTNLSLSDRYRVYKTLSDTFAKRQLIELSLPKNTYVEVEEADGLVSKRLNQAIYSWNRNQWVYEQILNEAAEISVVNASGVDGVARVVGRMIDSAGGRVVELLSGNKVYQGKCLVIGDGKKWRETIKYLEVNFECKVSDGGQVMEWAGKQIGSDIVLITGGGLK